MSRSYIEKHHLVGFGLKRADILSVGRPARRSYSVRARQHIDLPRSQVKTPYPAGMGFLTYHVAIHQCRAVWRPTRCSLIVIAQGGFFGNPAIPPNKENPRWLSRLLSHECDLAIVRRPR